jgi:hypothetical protein
MDDMDDIDHVQPRKCPDQSLRSTRFSFIAVWNCPSNQHAVSLPGDPVTFPPQRNI